MQLQTDEVHISGKECRQKMYKSKQPPVRYVPAFTYQALQKNAIVTGPPKVDVYKKRPKKKTNFAFLYERGDIPANLMGLEINSDRNEFPIKWVCQPEKLSFCYYLPIFIDGLADKNPDIHELAKFGAMDMIMKAPDKVLAVIPQCIMPFKRAMNTQDKRVVRATLRVIRMMLMMVPCAGIALVPFYRQLLSVCNLYKNMTVHLRCGTDLNPQNHIADVIEETLRMMEQCGGPNAYINIKYMVPTYESNVQPRDTFIKPCENRNNVHALFSTIGTHNEQKSCESIKPETVPPKKTEKPIEIEFGPFKVGKTPLVKKAYTLRMS